MSDRAEEVLRMEHITKQFGSVYANRNVSFDVLSGEVHTLLGENGAGKSTLMNVLFGLYQPTGGEIYIRGGEVNASEVTGEELAAKMIRRELKTPQYPKVEETGEDVIVLDHVSYHKESKHNGLNDVSLRIRRGEAVGIAGVDGNGQSQLAMLTTGDITPEEGTIELKGSKVVKFDPNGFIRENVSHIPEDRNKAGLIGNMSVADNLVLKTITDSRFSDRILVMFEGKIMGEYPGKNPPVREISLAMAGK